MVGKLITSKSAGYASHGLRRLPEYVERRLPGHVMPGAQALVDLGSGALNAKTCEDIQRVATAFEVRMPMLM